MGYFTQVANNLFFRDFGFVCCGSKYDISFPLEQHRRLHITINTTENKLYLILYSTVVSWDKLEKEINIPDNVLTDKYTFAEWLDEHIEEYL